MVRFASFQLGADTGRGTVPGRDPVVVTQASVCQAIEQGAGITLNFDALHGGHRSCNRYALLLSIGQQHFDALQDAALAQRVMHETAGVEFDRGQSLNGAWAMAKALLRHRHLAVGVAKHAARMLWQARGQWFSQGRIVPSLRKISFFTHNFMDACDLDAERVDACVFMAATAEGPMSMCQYNAERERILLQPIVLASGETWQPLAVAPDANGEIRIPLKWLKGKPRETAMAQRPRHQLAEIDQ